MQKPATDTSRKTKPKRKGNCVVTRYLKPCSRCQTKDTKSATGICPRCRADNVPSVELCDDGYVRVGNALLTIAAALTLAHKIADVLTP